jgi:hypothetical protein
VRPPISLCRAAQRLNTALWDASQVTMLRIGPTPGSPSWRLTPSYTGCCTRVWPPQHGAVSIEAVELSQCHCTIWSRQLLGGHQLRPACMPTKNV